MEYTKTIWKDLPDTSTPITVDRLQNIEDCVKYLFEHGVGGRDTLPIGVILPFSDTTVLEGYILWDGTSISRTNYTTLFSIMGIIYGEGDGSTTFNLPNLKGRVLVGRDTTDEDLHTLSETGGEKEHSLTVDEMPSHTHMFKFSYKSNEQQGSGNIYFGDGRTYNTRDNSNKTEIAGGNQTHNILQPY